MRANAASRFGALLRLGNIRLRGHFSRDVFELVRELLQPLVLCPEFDWMPLRFAEGGGPTGAFDQLRRLEELLRRDVHRGCRLRQLLAVVVTLPLAHPARCARAVSYTHLT